jgi:hypothetical protein
MKVPHWVALAGVLCALLAGGFMFGVGCLAWLAGDAGSPVEFWVELGDQNARSRDLEVRCGRVREHIHRKEQLAQDVAQRRMTLLQAAARFQELDQAKPDFNWDEFRRGHAGQSDAEHHCREVIAWVEVELEGRPERKGVVQRLEAELAEDLRYGRLGVPQAGAVVLPVR